jgi:hypothetical protein
LVNFVRIPCQIDPTATNDLKNYWTVKYYLCQKYILIIIGGKWHIVKLTFSYYLTNIILYHKKLKHFRKSVWHIETFGWMVLSSNYIN